MATSKPYDIDGIDLSDNSYTVEQSLVKNKYEALDVDGNTVVQGKQNLFESKEEFPFADADGNEAFTVKAERAIDVVIVRHRHPSKIAKVRNSSPYQRLISDFYLP